MSLAWEIVSGLVKNIERAFCRHVAAQVAPNGQAEGGQNKKQFASITTTMVIMIPLRKASNGWKRMPVLLSFAGITVAGKVYSRLCRMQAWVALKNAAFGIEENKYIVVIAQYLGGLG